MHCCAGIENNIILFLPLFRTCQPTSVLPVSVSAFDGENSVDDPDPDDPPPPNHISSQSSSGTCLLTQKKRYYREEWKVVKNDEKGTEERLQNLAINSNDAWGMWCKACTRFAPELGLKYCTNFVKDFPQFKPPRPKKETVDSHFSSSAHAKCSEKAKVFDNPATSTPIYQKLAEIDSLTLQRMTCLMRTVFYFGINDRAGYEFSSECELQKMNGANLGNTYQNNMSFTVLLKYVAMSLQNSTIDALNKAQFISVMTDGSTTRKTTEYEAIVIRHIHQEKFCITNSLIGLCKIERGDAAGLADAITKCLESSGVKNWQEKLICLTVDGAAVNVGKHNGLVKLIDSPIYIHCFNHVLDLCLKDSIKGNVAAMKAITFVKSISSFYRTSPKLTRELFRAGEALNLKLVTFKPVCETRWADSLESAVIAVVRNFAAVVQHLTDVVSEHSASKYTNNIKSAAKGLLLDLTTFEVLRFFYAFSDFILLFSNTSKYLETSNIDIVQAAACVKSLQIDLLNFGSFGELKCSQDKHLTTFLVTVDDTSDNIIFQNVILQKEKSKRNSKIVNHFKDLCEKASEIMKKRFSNNDGSESVLLRTAKTLNTAYFPSIIPENYGDSQIAEFCTLFNISVDSALAEWKEFRSILSENFRPEIGLRELLTKLQTNSFKKMQTILQIVEIILTIPPSNAEVERVWSSVKHTLDDRSLSMGQDTLQHRLQIRQSKVKIENFDPTSAVNLWWNDTIRCRRPNFNQ